MCLVCGCQDHAPLHPLMPGVVGYNRSAIQALAPPQGDSYPTISSSGFAIAAQLPNQYCYMDQPEQNKGNSLTEHQIRPYNAKVQTMNVPGQQHH